MNYTTYFILGVLGILALLAFILIYRDILGRLTRIEKRMDELDPKRLPYPVADELENVIANILYIDQALTDAEIKNTIARQRADKARVLLGALRAYGIKGNGKKS